MTIRALEFPSKQYMPIIFANSEAQFSAASESLMRVRKKGTKPITAGYVNVAKAERFWPEPDNAHQHYYRTHPKPQWM